MHIVNRSYNWYQSIGLIRQDKCWNSDFYVMSLFSHGYCRIDLQYACQNFKIFLWTKQFGRNITTKITQKSEQQLDNKCNGKNSDLISLVFYRRFDFVGLLPIQSLTQKTCRYCNDSNPDSITPSNHSLIQIYIIYVY